jgi:hypothetical protein
MPKVKNTPKPPTPKELLWEEKLGHVGDDADLLPDEIKLPILSYLTGEGTLKDVAGALRILCELDAIYGGKDKRIIKDGLWEMYRAKIVGNREFRIAATRWIKNPLPEEIMYPICDSKALTLTIRLNTYPNGQWTYGHTMQYSSGGSFSHGFPTGELFQTREEAIKDALRMMERGMKGDGYQKAIPVYNTHRAMYGLLPIKPEQQRIEPGTQVKQKPQLSLF